MPYRARGAALLALAPVMKSRLVVRGDQVTVYVAEPDNQPLSAKEWTGKATVLVGGKDGSAAGRVTAVLQLIINGKPAQARFAIAP